jgi:hypothetical protein
VKVQCECSGHNECSACLAAQRYLAGAWKNPLPVDESDAPPGMVAVAAAGLRLRGITENRCHFCHHRPNCTGDVYRCGPQLVRHESGTLRWREDGNSVYFAAAGTL